MTSRKLVNIESTDNRTSKRIYVYTGELTFDKLNFFEGVFLYKISNHVC